MSLGKCLVFKTFTVKHCVNITFVQLQNTVPKMLRKTVLPQQSHRTVKDSMEPVVPK